MRSYYCNATINRRILGCGSYIAPRICRSFHGENLVLRPYPYSGLFPASPLLHERGFNTLSNIICCNINSRKMLQESDPRLPRRELSTKITDSPLPTDRDIPKGETVTRTSTTELSAEGVGVRSGGDDNNKIDKDVADNTESSTTTDEEEEEKEEEQDQRTWRENARAALWTVPNPDPADMQVKDVSSRSFRDYTRAVRLTWSDYKETWEGFLDNFKDKGEEEEEEEDITTVLDTDAIIKKREELKGNTKRNVKALREEGYHALEFAKESTGVRNKKDLKKWVAKQIKLASLCVNAFMNGYREGRDKEVDKMLNEYFKEFDEEESSEVTKETQITTEMEGGADVQSKELAEVQVESRKGERRRRNRKKRKR